MSTLHLIRESASKLNFNHYLKLVNEQDQVIFLDDGCYNINNGFISQLNTPNISVIKEHLIARGLDPCAGVTTLSAVELPQQLFLHDNSITWNN